MAWGEPKDQQTLGSLYLCFKRNVKHDSKEFARQLKEQEKRYE